MAIFTKEFKEQMAVPGDYLNKFPQGTTKLRILSEDSVTGFEAWTADRRPIRKKTVTELPANLTHKAFAAMVVWNYTTEQMQIWIPTQRTILDTLMELEYSSSWGDLRNYDIDVKRTGEDMETKYLVTPQPPKKLDDAIYEAFKESGINLEALYATEKDPHGGDPFAVATTEDTSIDPDSVPF